MLGDSEPADGARGPATRRGRPITLREEGRQFQVDLKQKTYRKVLGDLKKVGVNIVKRCEEIVGDEGGDTSLTQEYIQWKRMYINFIQTESELEALLTDRERKEHTARHQVELEDINLMKAKMEAKLEPTHETPVIQQAPSVRSTGTSVRSRISLLRLSCDQQRAEVEAKAVAVKKRQELERQRQELEWQMQKLEVENERNILEAKEEALHKFEVEEGLNPASDIQPVAAPAQPAAATQPLAGNTHPAAAAQPPVGATHLAAATKPLVGATQQAAAAQPLVHGIY